MRRIWLVGMPGAGKTTVGRELARRLNVEFVDTDDLVEALTGEKISDLWLAAGESRFRDFERMVIAGLEQAEGIIATGGGAVLDPENRKVMTGSVVWLEATPDTLTERLSGGPDRPVLTGSDALVRTLLIRTPVYRTLAGHRVCTDDRSVDEIVEELITLW